MAEKPDDNYFTLGFEIEPTREWVALMTWPKGVPITSGPVELQIIENDDNPPTSGLSHTVLREIDFKKAIEMARAASPHLSRFDPDTIIERLIGLSDGPISEDYLAHLAFAYVHLTGEGQSKPVEHLAEMTGKSVSAMRQNLWRATREGLLERSPGRAGGTVTAKATRLLDVFGTGQPLA